MTTKTTALQTIVSAITFLLMQHSIIAQSWRFPSCDELEVKNIELDASKLIASIDIFNHCDSCNQHVYTGVVLYNNTDTLALSKNLFSGKSPDNKSTETYDLQMRQHFTQNDITRIQMVAGVCDSIPFYAVDNSESLLKTDILVFPNPVRSQLYFTTKHDRGVNQVSLINTMGKTVFGQNNPISPLPLKNIPYGIYFIRFSMEAETIVQTIRIEK